MAASSFASAATAKAFIANMSLGDAPGSAPGGAGFEPMGNVLSTASIDPKTLLTALAGAIGGTGGTGATGATGAGAAGASAATGASGTTGAKGAAAATPATPATPAAPDPTTLSGALDLKNQVQQNFAVGSGIISFDQGVTADRKSAAINSTLLAQLYADQLYPNRDDPAYAANWYATYFNTLLNIGWLLQGSAVAKTFTGQNEGDVEAAVIKLAEGLVGANALSAIKAVLDSLSALADNNNIIVLFEHSSETNRIAQFSVSLASETPTADFSITGMGFDLTAKIDQTQVIFFKWKTETVTLNYRDLQLTVADDVYKQVADDIAGKVGPYVKSFVKEIVLAPPPPGP